MNVKLKALTAGVLFFTGQALLAQEVKTDSTATKEIKEVEIVALGYGKKVSKSKDVTSSTTITSEVIANRPSTSFLNSISGSAPGISVNSGSGSPGSGKIDVSIRGISSLNSSTEPLYVIDGLMTSSTEFRNLNQNDIETVSILRDAQATAIYGNLGANGVVVITTKSGNFNSGLKLSYDVTTSFSNLPKHRYDLVNSRELLALQKKLGVGLGITLTDDQIANYNIDTDWSRALSRTGFTQNHNLGIRYGSSNFSSYTSLGYMENEGVIRGTDFKRFTVRTNLNGRSNNRRFTYNAQIGLGHSKRNQLDEETNSDISNNIIQNPLIGIVGGVRYIQSGLYANGRELYNAIGRDFSGGRNILILENIINGGIKKFYTQTSITANASASYEILDGLKITNKTGVTYKHNTIDFARTPNGYLSIAVAASNRAQYGGWETLVDYADTTINSVTNISYDKKVGDHSFTVAAYIDYLRAFYNYNSFTQNGLNPLNWSFGAGTGYVPFNINTPTLYRPTVLAEERKAGTLAYIGTLEYDYSSKYGISATIRRDGSFRFSDKNKWDTFWSVGGRWNIDKESFMDNSIFDILKLRASYGTNGNQNITAASSNMNPLLVGVNLVRDTYMSGTGYLNSTGYTTTLTNSELRWEKVSQLNIGLDFELFRRKLTGNIDVYNKKTKDMFFTIPVSAANGRYSLSGNNGDMRNRGIEATLRYTPIRNRQGLTLSAFANFSYNDNKITALPSENLTSNLVNAIGGRAYQWHLYDYIGVNPDNGKAQYRGKNGNITETPTSSDRVLTGKSPYAPYGGGFGLEIDYKGFYLTSLFRYQKGGWAMDTMEYWQNRPSFAEDQVVSRDLLNAWTPQNKNTNVPVLTNNESLLNSSDKFLRRTDFIKLKNVTIGYNVQRELLRNLPITSLKVYLMGENLITWANDWKGFDPEPIKGSSLGVYPNVRTYSVGVNLEF